LTVPATEKTALFAVFRRITSDGGTAVAPSAGSGGDLSEPQFHGFEDEVLVPDVSARSRPEAMAEDFAPLVAIVPEPGEDARAPEPDIAPSATIPAPAAPIAPTAAIDRVPAMLRRPAWMVRLSSPAAELSPLAPDPPVALPQQGSTVLAASAPRPPAPAAAAPIEPPPTPAGRQLAERARAAVAATSGAVSDRDGRQRAAQNRRLYRRVRIAAELVISDVPCTLIDVSIGGFAATGITGIGPTSVVPVSLRLTIDGIEVGTRLNARVVYATETRLGGRFIDLTASQTAFLRYVVTWRGESVGMVGTTTLLDAITGGPDRLHPSGSKRDNSVGRERWWSGLIGRKISPPR
jgi:hypothetical protein